MAKIVTLTTPHAGKDVEPQERSFIAGGNAKWFSHCARQFLRKLNIVLPYDPAIILLGVYSNELKTHIHIKT